MLFPYAAERLQSHLEATYDSADTQKDIQLFLEQVLLFVRSHAGLLWVVATLHADNVEEDGQPGDAHINVDDPYPLVQHIGQQVTLTVTNMRMSST